MDHLDFIKLLLDKGANVNARMKDSTETRTVFTNQWLDENGATAFLRASQSGDCKRVRALSIVPMSWSRARTSNAGAAETGTAD